MRCLSLFFLFLLTLESNPPIRLINGSFENDPQDATVPTGWQPCKAGTTPDILPGFWGVYNEPADGETYMGLITRTDNTWEAVGQPLNETMRKGECYDFNLDLAHSKTYADYNMPVILRIWGGKGNCNRAQLLGETKAIIHTEWRNYEFTFYPKGDYDYIIFEAHYTKGLLFYYNGNILLDNCSPIIKCIRA